MTKEELQNVSAQLKAISEDRDTIGDYLDNETGAQFAALSALIVECRATLDGIEQIAREELQRVTQWHRAALNGIESCGVV